MVDKIYFHNATHFIVQAGGQEERKGKDALHVGSSPIREKDSRLAFFLQGGVNLVGAFPPLLSETLFSANRLNINIGLQFCVATSSLDEWYCSFFF